ncbi:DUF4873 domain-containing protein [Kibdelosporangium philippinense]|uniref:DUF4873 domain-containing protein n=1 Tax=Kibdelosporangium philippinense TaxID=211113 RepID=A0ABS8Z3E6_9PSEU|nr:DUF4873 domain-containing protein [Kibdelosporangium philippinense]MCE7001449.1 DUF4873 domain-containing protein [Kibdelosporangium philippinense]
MKVALIDVPDRMIRMLPGFAVVLLDEAVKHEFDPRCDMWTVTAPSGRATTARVIVASYPVRGPNTFLFERNNYRYIKRCLRMMGRQDARRIEARPEARISYRRKPDPHNYIFTPYESDVDETHRGPAVLTVDGKQIDVQVHLMGHVQPIDGSYRWYGRIMADLDVTSAHKSGRNDVTVRLPGGLDREGRLTELDPWGNIRITGSGRPPFRYP